MKWSWYPQPEHPRSASNLLCQRILLQAFRTSRSSEGWISTHWELALVSRLAQTLIQDWLILCTIWGETWTRSESRFGVRENFRKSQYSRPTHYAWLVAATSCVQNAQPKRWYVKFRTAQLGSLSSLACYLAFGWIFSFTWLALGHKI